MCPSHVATMVPSDSPVSKDPALHAVISLLAYRFDVVICNTPTLCQFKLKWQNYKFRGFYNCSQPGCALTETWGGAHIKLTFVSPQNLSQTHMLIDLIQEMKEKGYKLRICPPAEANLVFDLCKSLLFFS